MNHKGVLRYTIGRGEVKVAFPNNEVLCHWCPFCRSNSELKRSVCQITNEMLFTPFDAIGNRCPLDFEKEE